MDGGRGCARPVQAFRMPRWGALALLIVILMLAATACVPGRRAAPTPTKPAASEPGPAPDLLCGGTSGRACQLKLFALQPDDGVASLTARLDRATASIDYSPFLLDQPDIV